MKRAALVALWKQHKFVAVAARIVAVSRATAHYWIKRFRATGSLKDLRRPGRKATLSAAAIAAAQEAVLASQSVRHATSQLVKQGLIPPGTSHSTIYRNLSKGPGAIKCKGVRKVPVISDKTAKSRQRFAQHHRNHKTNWKRVLFVDSKYFYVSLKGTRKLWVRAGDKALQPAYKRGAGFHVYGAFSASGTASLLQVSGGKYKWQKGVPGVRAPEYIHVLKTHLIPAAKRLFKGKKWQLLHDGAGPHKAKATKACLAQQGVQVVALWPGNSPDLNPIENIWSWVQRHINKMHVTSLDELMAAVHKVWSQIPSSLLQTLANSMTTRLAKLEARDGGRIDY